MGAGVWKKIKNFFRDMGRGMNMVFDKAKDIVDKIPVIGGIAGPIISGLDILTDENTYKKKK